MAGLLDYRGDAGLGSGSNAQIPVTADKTNLDTINQTARDLMLLDNERNIKIFQQKVQDRDNLAKMILEDQVATGDILPQYQTYFDRAKKRVEDIFYQWGGNYNDTAGFNKYKGAVQELKDVAAHAQVNTKGIKSLQTEVATAALPRKKADIAKWTDGQMKQDFWNPVVPYQQLHDFNMDDILSGVAPVKTEVTDPNNPLFKYDVSYIDYNDILRNKRNQYIGDMDAADSIDQFVDKFQRYNLDQQKQSLKAIDSQIEKYNKDRGFDEANPNFVKPMGREMGADGLIHITEPKTNFAAKYALANQPQFVTRTPKFQKDIADYGLKKEKMSLEGKKMGIDSAKAGAYVSHMNALTRKLNDQLKAEGTNIEKQYLDFINNITPAGIRFNQKGKGEIGQKDAIYLSDLPQGYQFINGVIATKDKNGNPTGKVVAGKLDPFVTTDGRKISYYIPKYVDKVTGDKISFDNLPKPIQDAYDAAKSKRNISVNDFVKALLKKGAIELVLQGKNGTANYTSMFQAAKTMNAAGTTKGEENILNPPDNLPPENDNEQPQ